MNEEEFEKRLNQARGNLSTTMNALIGDYPKAVMDGRLAAWSAAMHAVIENWVAVGDSAAMAYDRSGAGPAEGQER